MNMRILPCWFTLAAALLIAGAAEAAVPTAISRLPYTISKPGRYLVSKNLVGNFLLNGIIIEADDVVLDLGGWTLEASGDLATGLNACIYGNNRHNVTIRNGRITGYLSGILLDGTNGEHHLVEDMHIEKCLRYGIQVKGSGSTVRHNRVTQIGGSTVFPLDRVGIDVMGDAIQVTDNEISDVLIDPTTAGNKAFGIRLFSSRSATISGNRILNSEAAFAIFIYTVGISVDGVSGFCILAGNQISGYVIGIDFDTTHGNNGQHVFRDNTVMRASNPYNRVTESASTKGPNNYP